MNALPPEPETSFVALVVKQFDDVMVKVLVAAAARRWRWRCGTARPGWRRF